MSIFRLNDSEMKKLRGTLPLHYPVFSNAFHKYSMLLTVSYNMNNQGKKLIVAGVTKNIERKVVLPFFYTIKKGNYSIPSLHCLVYQCTARGIFLVRITQEEGRVNIDFCMYFTL